MEGMCLDLLICCHRREKSLLSGWSGAAGDSGSDRVTFWTKKGSENKVPKVQNAPRGPQHHLWTGTLHN